MQTVIQGDFRLELELRKTPDVASAPMFAEEVTQDVVGDLVLETFMRGLLAEALPTDPAGIRAEYSPTWKQEPFVDRLEVKLTALDSGQVYGRRYDNGRWVRRAELRVLQLRQQGQLGQEDLCYQSLVATRNGRSVELKPPVLEAPPIEERTWEELGIRRLGDGGLAAERPILVNRLLEEEILAQTREAGVDETGGAVLGQLARLPEPLPGTQTRLVTVLSASLQDSRHEGSAAKFSISPDALAEAAQIAGISGQRVLTIWHSHGWCEEKCDKQADCHLVSPGFMSADDYQVAARLCPSKATVMPICGWERTENDRPVLIIHAWEGGCMRPVPWKRYHP